ncbi:MAG: GvpL/GvpF family gas vesicle protein [Candidatus Marinimicrobia bacterium]|nr:GvpL/GvpF family gas vesicle protein [Candidatus Neomarinimicrobiota bacterium]
MEMMIYSIVSVKKNTKKLDALLAGIKGLSNTDLYVVTLDEIAAVVSDVNRADLIVDKSSAIEYAGVIETLAQQFTLLPVRYGSVMESTDTTKKMLERNYNEIQCNLLKVENKVEYGLKVFCDSEKLKTELKDKSETEPAIELEQGIEKSIYSKYLYKKLKEHRFEESLLAHIDAIIQNITTHLAQLNSIHRFKKMVTETTIIDVVILLKKNEKEGLIQAVKELQIQYTGLKFVLTGQWPPYNFVDITIK